MSARARLSRPIWWVAIALAGALVGIALQVVAGSLSDGSSLAAVATPVRSDGATVAGSPDRSPQPSAVSDPGGAALAGAPSVQSAVQTAEAEAAGATGTSAQPPAASAPSTGLRVSIPVLGIDARVVALGFAADGQLDVPSDGTSVGWYEISPRPGEPGNALLGAHFDWGGSLAVFAGLNRLEAGDQVFISDGTAAQRLYEVSSVAYVGWDQPVTDILASEGSESSLTLFTCGGLFDRARGGYDERFVVRAVAADGSGPLIARR